MASQPSNGLQQRRIRREQRRSLPAAIQQRNEQVLRHCGLAHLATSRQLGRGAGEHDDLLQEAYLGLIQGSERFDAARGHRFSSYAMRLATGRIQHYRRDRVRCLRIPWRLDALHAQGVRLQEHHAQSHKPPLNDREIASALGVSLERWHQARIGHQHHLLISLDQTSSRDGSHQGAGGDDTLIQQLPDATHTNPADHQRDWLQAQLEQLPQRARSCLMRHFLAGRSVRAIAAEDGCSCSDVRDILQSALQLLSQRAMETKARPSQERSCHVCAAAMANTAATAV
ncbi:MAG: sigma-70 family RNA polymerase sigma factor [Synechococcus sp.]